MNEPSLGCHIGLHFPGYEYRSLLLSAGSTPPLSNEAPATPKLARLVAFKNFLRPGSEFNTSSLSFCIFPPNRGPEVATGIGATVVRDAACLNVSPASITAGTKVVHPGLSHPVHPL